MEEPCSFKNFVESETNALSFQLNDLIAHWRNPFPAMTDSLIARMAFSTERDASHGWPGQFDALTLLYPLLHTQLLPGTPIEVLRQWNLIHGLYLIHAIIEDRLLDEQLSRTAPIHLYDKLALLEAEQRRHALACGESDWPWKLHQDYLSQQACAQTGWRLEVERTWSSLEQELEQAAVNRAALGFIATAELLHSQNIPGQTLEAVFEAFGWLVTALQWCDDFEDWVEDAQFQRTNFMLARMGYCLSYESRCKSSFHAFSIRESLIATGAASYAMRRAHFLLMQAAHRYESLGNTWIPQLILKKADQVLQRKEDHESGVARELIAGFEFQVATFERSFGEVLS